MNNDVNFVIFLYEDVCIVYMEISIVIENWNIVYYLCEFN